MLWPLMLLLLRLHEHDNDEDWLFAFSLPCTHTHTASHSQLSTHRRIPIGFDVCSMQLCLFYSLAHCVCDARLYTENEYKRSISEFEAGLWFRTTDDGNGDDTEKNTRKINELWTITHALPPEHNMANTREKKHGSREWFAILYFLCRSMRKIVVHLLCKVNKLRNMRKTHTQQSQRAFLHRT